VMQAGSSGTGARFAARHADIAFQSINEDEPLESASARFAELRRIGREDYGRSFEIWTGAWVICRPTEKEAQEFMRHCLGDHGDEAMLDTLPPEVMPREGSVSPEVLRRRRYKALGGWGGAHLVGTPEQIVERLPGFSRAGADGVVLSWVDYVEGLETWTAEVMPLLEQAGLRLPRSPLGPLA